MISLLLRRRKHNDRYIALIKVFLYIFTNIFVLFEGSVLMGILHTIV